MPSDKETIFTKFVNFLVGIVAPRPESRELYDKDRRRKTK